MIDFAADLPILFADCSTPATVMISGHRAGVIDVLMEQPGKGVSPLTGLIESTAPAALVKQADVIGLGITHGAQLIIDGTTWQVVGMEPDGMGLSHLILSKDTDQ